MRNSIEKKLSMELAPEFIEVIDESHNHNVPYDAQTHFKVTLVSEAFTDLRPVKRHQRIYGCLSEELSGSVHALALHLYTPDEWRQKQGSAPSSPPCLGGSKSDNSL